MKGHILHRARAHLKVPGCSLILNALLTILVPRAYDPFGLWLGSRALAGPDILSMRRVFVSHCQPIRFAGFDGKSVIHGLPVKSSKSDSRPQSLRSFWPVVGIESSGRTRYSEHAQSIRFALSTNQICWI